MKLCDLLETCIEGDVRLSLWDENGDEFAVAEFRDIHGLSAYDLKKHGSTRTTAGGFSFPENWLNYEVAYIFAPGDGFLHIEVRAIKLY